MTANGLEPTRVGETDGERAVLGAAVGAATGLLAGGMVGVGVLVGRVPELLPQAGGELNLIAYTAGSMVVCGLVGALTGWGYGGDAAPNRDTQ